MKYSLLWRAACALFLCLATIGCGGTNGTTVLEPLPAGASPTSDEDIPVDPSFKRPPENEI